MSILPTHVKNYFQAFGYDKSSFIHCEVCHMVATDIHHVDPRSSFGSKRKNEQDQVLNLIALCRKHHNEAHGPKSREWKIIFKEMIAQRVYPFEPHKI